MVRKWRDKMLQKGEKDRLAMGLSENEYIEMLMEDKRARNQIAQNQLIEWRLANGYDVNGVKVEEW